MHVNTWKRKALTVLSVPLLAVPSAMGVYGWLEPESGPLAAGFAAAGFELLYIGVNVLVLSTPELRQYAQRVSLAAVGTAVLFNALYHYALKVPEAFTGAAFNPIAAALSLIMAVPLAGLAYAVSVLLHRLSEEEAPAAREEKRDTPAPATMPLQASWPRQEPYPAPLPVAVPIASHEPAQTLTAPVNSEGARGNTGNAGSNGDIGPMSNGPARVYRCKHCGTEGLTKGEQLTHGRRHAKERQVSA